MMTLHWLSEPWQASSFMHIRHADGRQVVCLTWRGELVCACGHYALCDPATVACPAACACWCHQEEEMYE